MIRQAQADEENVDQFIGIGHAAKRIKKKKKKQQKVLNLKKGNKTKKKNEAKLPLLWVKISCVICRVLL